MAFSRPRLLLLLPSHRATPTIQPQPPPSSPHKRHAYSAPTNPRNMADSSGQQQVGLGGVEILGRGGREGEKGGLLQRLGKGRKGNCGACRQCFTAFLIVPCVQPHGVAVVGTEVEVVVLVVVAPEYGVERGGGRRSRRAGNDDGKRGGRQMGGRPWSQRTCDCVCVCACWPRMIYVYAPSNGRRFVDRPRLGHALTYFQLFLPPLLPYYSSSPPPTGRRGRVPPVHGLPQVRDQLRMHALHVSMCLCLCLCLQLLLSLALLRYPFLLLLCPYPGGEMGERRGGGGAKQQQQQQHHHHHRHYQHQHHHQQKGHLRNQASLVSNIRHLSQGGIRPDTLSRLRSPLFLPYVQAIPLPPPFISFPILTLSHTTPQTTTQSPHTLQALRYEASHRRAMQTLWEYFHGVTPKAR